MMGPESNKVRRKRRSILPEKTVTSEDLKKFIKRKFGLGQKLHLLKFWDLKTVV